MTGVLCTVYGAQVYLIYLENIHNVSVRTFVECMFIYTCISNICVSSLLLKSYSVLIVSFLNDGIRNINNDVTFLSNHNTIEIYIMYHF